MSTSSTRSPLTQDLTRVVLATPGVTRLYPPSRILPVKATLRHFATDITSSSARGTVLVDDANATVTASISVDQSASTAEIIRTVCSRLKARLEDAPGPRWQIKITVAYIES